MRIVFLTPIRSHALPAKADASACVTSKMASAPETAPRLHEVALPISGNITVGPEYKVKTVDECKVVSYIYKGPYPDVGPAWKVVFEYIDRKGLKVAGNCRELYLNDPKETPETDLLTEIQVPVEV